MKGDVERPGRIGPFRRVAVRRHSGPILGETAFQSPPLHAGAVVAGLLLLALAALAITSG